MALSMKKKVWGAVAVLLLALAAVFLIVYLRADSSLHIRLKNTSGIALDTVTVEVSYKTCPDDFSAAYQTLTNDNGSGVFVWEHAVEPLSYGEVFISVMQNETKLAEKLFYRPILIFGRLLNNVVWIEV